MSLRVRVISLAVAGLGAAGIAGFVIPPFEGREYFAYPDIGGVWTICEGHTTGVKKGDIADDADCDRMTAQDVAIAGATLDRCAPGVAMPPYRRAAFIIFIHNMGPGKKGVKDGFCVLWKTGNWSTMRRKLVNGDQIGACNQLPLWNSAAGQKLKGLTERRTVERLICLGLIVEGAGHWHDWRKR